MVPQTNNGCADRQHKRNDNSDQRKKLREKKRPTEAELAGQVCGFGERDTVHGRGFGDSGFWEIWRH